MQILIVDDSSTMPMIVKRTIRDGGFGGHDLLEASNGQEAIEAIKDLPPDLVLTDWNMPEMSGIELLAALKEAEIDAAVGFITSHGTAEMRKLALDAGAKFLLIKPISLDRLKEVLERILE